ncbi:MAG: hypothetical protein RR937_08125, partial [Ruthenibacterium sp.]
SYSTYGLQICRNIANRYGFALRGAWVRCMRNSGTSRAPRGILVSLLVAKENHGVAIRFRAVWRVSQKHTDNVSKQQMHHLNHR